MGLPLLLYSTDAARRLPWLIHQSRQPGSARAFEDALDAALRAGQSQVALGLLLTVQCSEEWPVNRRLAEWPLSAQTWDLFAAACGAGLVSASQTVFATASRRRRMPWSSAGSGIRQPARGGPARWEATSSARQSSPSAKAHTASAMWHRASATSSRHFSTGAQRLLSASLRSSHVRTSSQDVRIDVVAHGLTRGTVDLGSHLPFRDRRLLAGARRSMPPFRTPQRGAFRHSRSGVRTSRDIQAWQGFVAVVGRRRVISYCEIRAHLGNALGRFADAG